MVQNDSKMDKIILNEVLNEVLNWSFLSHTKRPLKSTKLGSKMTQKKQGSLKTGYNPLKMVQNDSKMD